MSQQRIAASIYYDFDKDRYYRVDKNTGEVLRANKNGSLPKMFKIDVTGNDYKLRQSIENHSRHDKLQLNFLQKGKIHLANIKRSIPAPSQKILLPHKLSPLKEEQYSNRKSGDKKRDKRQQNSLRVKSEMNESHEHFMTGIETEEPSLHKHSSHIGSLLNKFSKLKELKIYENHCNLSKDAGTINGRQPRNSKGFRETKNSIYQAPFHGQSKHLIPIQKLGSNAQLKETMHKQLNKEKQMFLKFHPKFQQRQNLKLVNEQMERKKNLKGLEQLFLEQTSKITNQIYT